MRRAFPLLLAVRVVTTPLLSTSLVILPSIFLFTLTTFTYRPEFNNNLTLKLTY